MRKEERNELASLKRVKRFGASQWPTLSAMQPSYKEQLDVVSKAIDEVAVLAAEQQSGSITRSADKRRALKRKLRREILSPMRKISRIIEKANPGIPHLVNLPARRASEETVLAAARAVLNEAGPFQQEFISRGMPADFMTRLSNGIAAIVGEREVMDTTRTRRVKATAGIRAALSRGRDAVQCLDIMIRPLCEADQLNGESTIAGWDSAMRLPQRGEAVLEDKVLSNTSNNQEQEKAA